jgi:uncharacterized membrane protein YqiK
MKFLSMIPTTVYWILATLVLTFIVLKVIGIRIIPSDCVGIVEKWWSFKGSIKDGGIIALNGEAGYQPEVLRGGFHLRTPLMYRVYVQPLITIPQGKIGYVFARDGQAMEPTQTLGRVIREGSNFQNVRGFLINGGQKGPQRGILREGTYAFNLAQFIIITEDKTYYLPMGDKAEASSIQEMTAMLKSRNGFTPIIIKDTEDTIGVVTVHDGKTLTEGTIIAPSVGNNPNDEETYHNNFQDTEKFLKAGGFRGKQYPTLVDGTYIINRLFATIEYIPKTIINIGEVGVVNSYYGEKGIDVSGTEYKHGELVAEGCKGIWQNALAPGKYALNTYAAKVVKVPTTNVILKWISGQVGGHKLDENLKEISLITKDAFEPSLPLTVVFHIDYKKASSVIQRFGDVKMLIEQSIDPMISGYFKNVGQTMTLIELLQNRNEIQGRSSKEMKEKFAHYDLELEEVLIGTPAPSKADNRIETILAQLRDRQVAREQIETFNAQQKSAEKERELNEARAIAARQQDLTESNININIQDNKGKAEFQLATQEALKIQKLAEANKYKTEKEADGKKYQTIKEAEAQSESMVNIATANAQKIEKEADAKSYELEKTGNAEATRIKAVGESEAFREREVGKAKGEAYEAQVHAYGDPQYYVLKEVMSSFTDAIKEGQIALVPNIVMGSDNGKIPNVFENMMSLILTEKITGKGLISDVIKEKDADLKR